MLRNLPQLINPKQLAFEGGQLEGVVNLMDMLRLQDRLCDTQGTVYINWEFIRNEKYHPTIQGVIQATLSVLCQRCLQPMDWVIDTKIALLVQEEGEKEEDVPIGYEVLALTKSSCLVPLIDLIEDELILALPFVTKHTSCPSNDYQLPDNLSQDNTFQVNPFNILSKLKNS